MVHGNIFNDIWRQYTSVANAMVYFPCISSAIQSSAIFINTTKSSQKLFYTNSSSQFKDFPQLTVLFVRIKQKYG